MKIEVNHYQSTASQPVELRTTVPHTTSVRDEAWRGFKFNAKIGGALTSLLIAVPALLIFFWDVVAEGGVMKEINFIEVLKGIGALIAAVLKLSF